MKKVLFASTALVATAGVASAEVALSGSAEMGIYGGSAIETQFFQDLDVTFTMSGSTDNGLTFGATVDLDESTGAAPALNNNADDGGASIFISGDFGTLTMGDTDGALDWALTDAGNIGNPGSLNDDETTHAGYRGNYLDGVYDGQIVRYDNTFGDFGVAFSVEMDDAANGRDTGYALGVRYNVALAAGNVALGVGYQQATAAAGYTLNGLAVPVGDVDAAGVSATLNLDSGLSAGVVYAKYDVTGNNDIDQLGVGVGYSFGALALHANYGKLEDDAGNEYSGYGVAAGYDLGGGAMLKAGYGDSDRPGTANDTDTFSFGLAMSF